MAFCASTLSNNSGKYFSPLYVDNNIKHRHILHLSNYSLAIACAFALYVIYKAIITQA